MNKAPIARVTLPDDPHSVEALLATLSNGMAMGNQRLDEYYMHDIPEDDSL